MEKVKATFLSAKHWQIFVAFVVVPMLLEVVGMFGGYIAFSALLTAVYGLCFSLWFWSLGTFLSSRVKSPFRLNLRFFFFSLIFPVLYMPFFFWAAFSGHDEMAIIVPLHLLAMFCMFYLLYFVSKSFVMAESGKAASFSDYAGPLMLFWFFPIGIWAIQPRINRLYSAEKV